MRIHITHLLAALGIGLTLWLLLRAPSDSEPLHSGGPGPRTEAASTSRSGAATWNRQLLPTPPAAKPTADTMPDRAGDSDESDTPVGLRGVVKEIGSVVDTDVGIPGVRLQFVDADHQELSATTSDESGRFSFPEHLLDESWLVTQAYPGAPRLLHRRSGLRRGIRPGTPGANLPVTVWIPPAARIEGRVVDPAGRPVQGATVSTHRPAVLGLMAAPFTEIEAASSPVELTERTDALGRFALTSVLRGEHILRVTHAGTAASTRCEAGDRNALLRLGDHQALAVSIEGHLRNRASGEPVAGARITARFLREARGRSSVTIAAQATTDAQGRYELHGLEPGFYHLSAWPPDHTRAASPRRSYDAGSHVVDLAVERAVELRVRVLEPDGSPATGVRVRVEDAAGLRYRVPSPRRHLRNAVDVDADGEAVLRALPPRPLKIYAFRDDLLPAGEAEVDLRSRQHSTTTIWMPEYPEDIAREHVFRLRGPDGQPAEFDGVAIAEVFEGERLLSRVAGAWHGDRFVSGHSGTHARDRPTLTVAASAGACRVQIFVPGHRKYEMTLSPTATSPTTVRLQR